MSDYNETDLTRAEGEPTPRADVEVRVGMKILGFETSLGYSGVEHSSFLKMLVAVCALLLSLIPAGAGAYGAHVLGMPNVGVMIAGGVLYLGCLLMIGIMIGARQNHGRKRQV